MCGFKFLGLTDEYTFFNTIAIANFNSSIYTITINGKYPQAEERQHLEDLYGTPYQFTRLGSEITKLTGEPEVTLDELTELYKEAKNSFMVRKKINPDTFEKLITPYKEYSKMPDDVKYFLKNMSYLANDHPVLMEIEHIIEMLTKIRIKKNMIAMKNINDFIYELSSNLGISYECLYNNVFATPKKWQKKEKKLVKWCEQIDNSYEGKFTETDILSSPLIRRFLLFLVPDFTGSVEEYVLKDLTNYKPTSWSTYNDLFLQLKQHMQKKKYTVANPFEKHGLLLQSLLLYKVAFESENLEAKIQSLLWLFYVLFNYNLTIQKEIGANEEIRFMHSDFISNKTDCVFLNHISNMQNILLRQRTYSSIDEMVNVLSYFSIDLLKKIQHYIFKNPCCIISQLLKFQLKNFTQTMLKIPNADEVFDYTKELYNSNFINEYEIKRVSKLMPNWLTLQANIILVDSNRLKNIISNF